MCPLCHRVPVGRSSRRTPDNAHIGASQVGFTGTEIDYARRNPGHSERIGGVDLQPARGATDNIERTSPE